MMRATGKPRVSVQVVVLDAGWERTLPGVERLVRRAARAAATRGKSLNVALSDDKGVRALNKRDRKKDKPTNVLSYPSGERAFLGDIVLARQTVWREARAQKKTPADHVAHLVVHGVLHLLGHDHETGDEDAERMEARERRILAKLGIADPYIAR
jgi:probable rRNA maturation factor